MTAAPDRRLLTDEEAEEIRRAIDGGTRGPILLKWVWQLLADRDARRAAEQVQAPPPVAQA